MGERGEGVSVKVDSDRNESSDRIRGLRVFGRKSRTVTSGVVRAEVGVGETDRVVYKEWGSRLHRDRLEDGGGPGVS